MKYKNNQLVSLIILRILIGWHLLYEGAIKLANPDWSSVTYLNESQGFISGLFQWLAENPFLLQMVDYINIWLLILIGISLISGLMSKTFSLLGVILLLLYYLSNPPFFGLATSLISEGNYLIVNKTLIEIAALLVIYLFPTSLLIGLDRFILHYRGKGSDGQN